MSVIVLYRLSDNGYAKNKFPFISKIVCLKNFVYAFPTAKVHLLIDNTNLKIETSKNISDFNRLYSFENITYFAGGNGSQSWRYSVDYMKDLRLNDSQMILFQEDDYLYRENSQEILNEGLEVSDYCALYDHPDKYIDSGNGGNAFVEDGGEVTKVIRTKNSHWKLTNSTTMTFATRVKTLREDWDIWDKHTSTSHPNDFSAFIELRNKGRSLITPIPSYSTHCEVEWAAPGINWQEVMEK